MFWTLTCKDQLQTNHARIRRACLVCDLPIRTAAGFISVYGCIHALLVCADICCVPTECTLTNATVLCRMAHDALKWGVCTKSPEFVHGFGQWLREVGGTYLVEVVAFQPCRSLTSCMTDMAKPSNILPIQYLARPQIKSILGEAQKVSVLHISGRNCAVMQWCVHVKRTINANSVSLPSATNGPLMDCISCSSLPRPQKRMYNPEWWTFNVPNLEQDAGGVSAVHLTLMCY